MGDKRIPISEANRDALTQLKRGDDTYDDVIERLLDGEPSGSVGGYGFISPLAEGDAPNETLDARVVDMDADERRRLAREVAEVLQG